jgi:anti-sigma factor RsiW
MTDCASTRLLLHGLIDGELDAANTLRCEAHLADCADCAASFAEMKALRETMSHADLRYPTPPGLAPRIERALARAGGRPPFLARLRPSWPIWSLGGGMAALAASLLVLLMVPRGPDLSAEIVSSHVRSLQAAHLVDVITSDRHSVKPWFAGRVDFSPPVVDTSPAGFVLAGGRLDYLDGRPVAAIVYRRRQHVINLFVWPGQGRAGPTAETRDGYNMLHWTSGGMEHWAVSDLNAVELGQFQALIAAGEPG